MLKLLIKATAVNLFKTKKSCWFISLKMLKWSTIADLFCFSSSEKVRLWIYLKQRSAADLFHWKSWNKVQLEIYFVETCGKRYGCEFIEIKEDLWISFIEKAELKCHVGFILLKLLIKGTAVNLFKRKKSCVFISLKMLK